MKPLECQGSDCADSSAPVNDREYIRICKRCGKPVCGWCSTHCNPSHLCVTDIQHHKKEVTK